MITKLRLKNFRSILNAEVRLPGRGLAVIVGANGSGKSNVVRAFDFISALHHEGLSNAVIQQGGSNSLMPKSLGAQALSQAAALVEYRMRLPEPPRYPEGLRPPGVRHRITFTVDEQNTVDTVSEVLEFQQPIAVARALDSPDDSRPDAATIPPFSRLRMAFHKTKPPQITTFPKLRDEHVADYITWFGFRFVQELVKPIESREDLLGILDAIRRQMSDRRGEAKREAPVTWVSTPFLAFSDHARVFGDTARNTKRFDFHVHSLRAEQQPGRGSVLHALGENLPAAVRALDSSEDTGVWQRIMATLRDVAPFIFDLRTKFLQTGREYIEFLETTTGRPVESWDASDGTLRALAILVAVETHPSHSTMIVEEPEKGLHPWAVRFLTRHVREAALRRNLQVVLTTHSPQVLEAADPSEVIVATRSHEEGTKLRRISEYLHGADIPPGELGRLWVKGLLGGHPHDA